MKSLAVALTLFCAAVASADINVALTPGPNEGSPAAASGLQTITTINSDTTITITCGTGVDCDFVAVRVGSMSIPLSTGATSCRGTIPLVSISSSGGSMLHITVGGDEVTGGPFKLQRVGTTSAAPADDCVPKATYPHDGNVAHFAVTPDGSILQYPERGVDEDDNVVVHVFGQASELEDIGVARRPTGAPTIVGGSVRLKLQSWTPCRERLFTLGEFPPGEAIVDIYVASGGRQEGLGTFTFKVKSLSVAPHEPRQQPPSDAPKNFSEALLQLLWGNTLGRVVVVLMIVCLVIFGIWHSLPDDTKVLIIKRRFGRTPAARDDDKDKDH